MAPGSRLPAGKSAEASCTGRPSARVVLCKEIVEQPGYLVFFTNYLSRKGRQLAGNPRAHRAAGTAVGSNPVPIVVPCHRVIRSGGELGNYGGGPEAKRFLLELEGAI